MSDPDIHFPKEFEEKYPYTVMYIRKYGIDCDMPYCYWRMSDHPKREELLKKCIEQGVTWEDIIGPYDGTKIY